MRGRIFIPKDQQSDIADVQLKFQSLDTSINFHNINGRYYHTYTEECEDLSNRMDIKIKDKNFIFYRILITRSGSDEFIFTIIGQCATKDLYLFDKFIKNKINGELI